MSSLLISQTKTLLGKPMLASDIVEKCKVNDRNAQLQLYRAYCDGMYIVAVRFIKNEDDAEDVLQEAFIKAFQKIHQFRAEVSFGAWLKKIVIRQCLDFIKSKKELTVSLDEAYLHVVEDDNWLVQATVNIDDVKLQIDRLPSKYKFVVMLFLIEGYDHQEISEILSISETACRTRLLRGKAQLKELLKENGYGTGS